MSSLVITVKTEHGVYEVWKPRGRIAPKHFAIFAKFTKIVSELQKMGLKDEEIFNVIAEDERVMELYEKWVNTVLPHIIKSSPFEFDEIPFEDQWLIFLDVMGSANFPSIDTDTFQ